MLLDGITTLDSFHPKGRKILLRVDVNSPVDRQTHEIEDASKVEAAGLTLNELLDHGAAVVLLAHQGRPGEYDFTSLRNHSQIMERVIGREVEFVPDVCGDRAVQSIRELMPGHALMLENVRQLDYEQRKGTAADHANTELVARLTPLVDYFVNDAFAAIHRPHCSMIGFTETLPSAAGRLIERELAHLSPLLDDPRPPVVYVFGGRKFGDFLPTLKSVASNTHVDRLLLTGYLAISFLMASGITTDSETRYSIEEEAAGGYFERAAELMQRQSKISLPLDMGFEVEGKRIDAPVDKWPENGSGLDIGPSTIEEYARIIASAGTVFISGPAGVYERREFERGTRSIFEAASRPGVYSVIGGGHTSAAAHKLGFESRVSYVSTGGGALEALITGKKLAVLESLRESAARFADRFTPSPASPRL